ncbi:MAG TPA: type II secretion system protein GspK [Candidatus Hydrogenedentes bacterium]|nr:type II secretion system protein GspK [Candidatus Hydrogenedentota bacterium]HOL78319.1 type II secretion system protein GspK [Candidatus Hydrogenedentota bacterium]HPO87172.1 type II secretion system protein GspK [Candidatus Hydrogenedentota bacterium]
MERICSKKARQEGVALLMAIALLLVFSILGSAYLRYMTIEVEKLRIDEGRTRAHHAAQAAVYAAIEEAKAALAEKRSDALFRQGPMVKDFPTYSRFDSEKNEYVVDDGVKTTVTWAIRDESGKLNINHAPASALRIVLGVDGAKAREICASLPRSEEGVSQGADRQWLTSPEELVTRGFLSSEAYRAVDQTSLTVYTVPDPSNPVGYINLNTASPKVLEAVLDVSPETAKAVAAARPFYSLADVCRAAGKPASMFNFKPDADAPESMPKALTLESNAFRVFSRAQVKRAGGTVLGTVEIEAVAVLSPEGSCTFTYWHETGAEKTSAIAMEPAQPTEAGSASSEKVNTSTQS